ncbi:hypothetical protein ACFFRR_006052 [Megaselia abdita]
MANSPNIREKRKSRLSLNKETNKLIMSPTPRTPIRASKAANPPDSPMCLTPLSSQRLNWNEDVDSPTSEILSPYSSVYSDGSDIFNRISDVTYNYEKRSDVRKRIPSSKPTQTRRGLTELYKFPKQTTKKEDTKKLQEWKKQIQIEEFCDTVLKLCKESDPEDDFEVKENVEPKIEQNSSQDSYVTAPNEDLFDDSANDHLILASQQVEKRFSPEKSQPTVPIDSQSTIVKEVQELKKTNSSLSAIFEDSFDLGDMTEDIKQTESKSDKIVKATIKKGSPPELKAQKSQKTPFQRYNSMPSTSLKEVTLEQKPLKKHPSSSSVNSSSSTSISSLSSASSTGSLMNDETRRKIAEQRAKAKERLAASQKRNLQQKHR